MPTYLWHPSDRPALGIMTATSLLDDGSVDDTTTFVEATRTQFVPSEPFFPQRADSETLTVVCDLGAPLPVGSWSARFQWFCAHDNVFSTTGSTLEAEYLDSQGAWQSLGSADTVPAVDGWDGQTQSDLTITTRYVRLVVTTRVLVYYPTGHSYTVAARLADFRVSESSAPPACPVPPPPVLQAASLFIAGVGTIRITGNQP